VNATQYRNHPSRALRRAFLRGELAGRSGVDVNQNSYKRTGRGRSWSEAYVTAWLVGWHHAHRDSVPAGGAVAPVDEGEGA